MSREPRTPPSHTEGLGSPRVGLTSPWFLLLAFLVTCVGAGCHDDRPHPASEPNLLAGHLASSTPGTLRPETATDGNLAPWADYWDTPLTAVLRGPDDSLTFDLGSEQSISAAFIEADNNDAYAFEVSNDGQTFSRLWVAPPVRPTGLQGRTAHGLHGRGRYVRISASGGDGAYSIAEVQVYARDPSEFPEAGKAGRRDVVVPHAAALLSWGLACLFFLLGCRGGRARALAFAVLPALATVFIVAGVVKDDPHYNDADVSLLRAVAAAVGVLVLVAEVIARRRGRPFIPSRVTAIFGLLALAGVASFYNLGRPQFYDAKLREPSYVHNYDMRVYFPVAKYFRELNYDGLYLASVASYIDNHPGTSVMSLAEVELRDLTTHEMRRVREVIPQVEAVRQRFSPTRWAEFCSDMLYFQDTMGRDYFSTMSDHGGNATPVWLTVAHFLFRWLPASNATLLFGAALDPLLLLVFAWVVARVYSARTAFFCLLVFGANDYYMFGTDWAGATLRHDWMIALGLGAAALRKERWGLGGALLAYGGLIRAFPALAVFALAVPPVIGWLASRRESGGAPSRAEILSRWGGLLRALGGAVVTVVVAVAVSSLVLKPGAWPAWVKKASVLSAGDHVNHLSLRTIASFDFNTLEGVGGWYRDPGRVIFFAVGLAIYTYLAGRAMVRRPGTDGGEVRGGAGADRIAMLGLFLIPVFFYPANYYFHAVFLLPLLAAPETTGLGAEALRARLVWAVLGLMCVVEYATTWAETLGRHFMGESFILMVTYLVLLLLEAYPERWARWLASFGAAAPEPEEPGTARAT